MTSTQDLSWLLANFADRVPGVAHAIAVSADGLLLCGDTAGFLNGARLKGIHLAIKSGMLAAETLFECLLSGDFSKERLAGYEKRFENSWARDELHGRPRWLSVHLVIDFEPAAPRSH